MCNDVDNLHEAPGSVACLDWVKVEQDVDDVRPELALREEALRQVPGSCLARSDGILNAGEYNPQVRYRLGGSVYRLRDDRSVAKARRGRGAYIKHGFRD